MFFNRFEQYRCQFFKYIYEICKFWSLESTLHSNSLEIPKYICINKMLWDIRVLIFENQVFFPTGGNKYEGIVPVHP